MQHSFQYYTETGDTETTLTITYEHTPPSRGQTGPHGEPLEPDTESEIEILSVTDEAGNDYDPETIENINSHCWDDLLEYFGGNYIQFYTMTKIKNGLFVAIIACFVAVSCVRETPEIAPVDTPEFFVKIDGDSIGFDLYVIDSCEYIGHLAGTSNSSVDFFVHKGNCRFCKERQSLFHSKTFVMPAYKKDYPFLKSGN